MKRRTVSHRLAGMLLTAFLTLGASAYAADAPAPQIAQARTLLEAGKAEEALNLLEPLEPQLAGDVEYDYLLGVAALNANQPSKATFIFERVLAVAPEIASVRADMGRAYYMLGDYSRAKIEFETLLKFQNLPPDLKGTADKYMNALEGGGGGGSAFSAYVEIGYGRDSNVGSATNTNPIFYAGGNFFALDPESLQRKNRYQALSTGFDYNHALEGGLSVYTGADFRGRFYQTIDTADYATVDVRGGLAYLGGRYVVSGGVVAGNYSLDNFMTRRSFGLTSDLKYTVDSANQFLLNGSYIRYEYADHTTDPDSTINDFETATLGIGWYRALSPTTALTVTLSGGKEFAIRERTDGDKDFFGARGTLQGSLAEKVSAYASLGAQAGRYQSVDATYDMRRYDRSYDLSMGVSWAFADRWTLRPQYSRIKNNSNVALYEYQKSDVSINLRREF